MLISASLVMLYLKNLLTFWRAFASAMDVTTWFRLVWAAMELQKSKHAHGKVVVQIAEK